MAQDNTDITSRLKEEITCPVCLDVYKEPKILDCQHAFCIECINVEIEDGERTIKCPKCREIKVLPVNGSVADLSPAIHANTLLDMYKATTQQRCPEHSHELNMFCEDCHKIICAECSCTIPERRHNCDLITRLYPKHHKEVQVELSMLEQHINKAVTSLMNLKIQETETAQQVKQAKEEIGTLVKELIEIVQRFGAQLEASVDDLVLKKKEHISVQKEEIEKSLKELRHQKEDTEKKLKLFKHEFVKEKSNLINKMKSLTQQPIPKPPDKEAIVFVSALDIVKKYQDMAVGEAVSIPLEAETSSPKPASVATCSGKGSTVALINRNTSFEVCLPTKPDGPVSCFLYNEESVPAAVACKVEEINRWFSYPFHVSFTPTHPGKHRIVVRVKGASVPCSPNVIWVNLSPEMREPLPILDCLGYLPNGVAITCEDELVVAGEAYGNDVINVYSSHGDAITTFGMKREESLCSIERIEHFEMLSLNLSPEYFCGLAVTSDHHVLVCDRRSDNVTKLTMDGTVVEAVGLKNYTTPHDVATDSKGRVYVSYDNGVEVRNPSLSYLSTIGNKERGSKPGQFDNPQGIAINSQDVLYVCDSGNSRVQTFSPDGKYIREFGKNVLREPNSIAIDRYNIAYVSDTTMNTIGMFNCDGEHLGDIKLEDLKPLAVAVNSLGIVLVCGNGMVWAC